MEWGDLKNRSRLNLCFDNVFKLISQKFKSALERTWKEAITHFVPYFTCSSRHCWWKSL